MVDQSLAANRSLDVAEGERFSMDEPEFSRFYSTTVHPLRGYLTRMSGDVSLADDLVQESYCRFLAVAAPPADIDGRRRYLFRIATNLLRDHHRRARREGVPIDDATEPADHGSEHRLQVTGDVGEVLRRLKPRQRALLWLAYVEGMQHSEIASVLGLSTLSIRPLLFRARRCMARALRARGLAGGAARGGTE